jgi:hypothetical protein
MPKAKRPRRTQAPMPGQFGSRADLRAYCKAEGLAFGTFHCGACKCSCDWYGLPSETSARIECPQCRTRS